MSGASSPLSDAWARFRRNRPALAGLTLIGALAVFAIVGPRIARWDPDASDFTLLRTPLGAPPGPSAAHWLGVDHLFRDVFARLAAGARVSLAIGVAAAGIATGLGTAIGVIAGMTEGTRLGALDSLAMRLVDVFLALPSAPFHHRRGRGRGPHRRRHGAAGARGRRLDGHRAPGPRPHAADPRARLRRRRPRAGGGVGRATSSCATCCPTWEGRWWSSPPRAWREMILGEAVLGYLAVGIPPPRAHLGPDAPRGRAVLREPGRAPRHARLRDPAGGAWLEPHRRRGCATRSRAAAADAPCCELPARPRRLPLDAVILAGSAILLLSFAAPNQVAAPSAPQQRPTTRFARSRAAAASSGSPPSPTPARSIPPSPSTRPPTPSSSLVFARLVTWDGEGHIAPDLARSFTTFHPDGRTYTFELRPGALFHDGTEVRARDVQRSLERLPPPPHPLAGLEHVRDDQGLCCLPHRPRRSFWRAFWVLGDRLLAIDLRRAPTPPLPPPR